MQSTTQLEQRLRLADVVGLQDGGSTAWGRSGGHSCSRAPESPAVHYSRRHPTPHKPARGRERGKTALPRNFYAFLAVGVVCLLVICGGWAGLMLSVKVASAAEDTTARAMETTMGLAWANNFTAAMTSALSAVKTLEGYVTSQLSRLPPLNRTPDTSGNYNINAYLSRFVDIAALKADAMPAVVMQSVSPNGLVTMTYPRDPTSIGRDLFDPNDPINVYSPTALQTAASGTAAFIGPRRSTIASLNGMWVIIARCPIYNRTPSEPASLDNFWGFSVLTLNATRVLNIDNVYTSSQESQVDYVLFDATARDVYPHIIASSLPACTSQSAYATFIAESTVTDVLPPFSNLQIALHMPRNGPTLSPAFLTNSLMWPLLVVPALFAAAVAIILWYRREYDAAAHAPKLAPFAMLTIASHRGEQLWDVTPEATAQVKEKIIGVLKVAMQRHGAYPIQQVTPYTLCYVTRHVSSAVQMAFSVIEELERHPVDAPLRAVLGKDAGRVGVCCAVHWCTDAAVRVESLQGSYRYEGPDVVFGGRMWAFAAPGVVTASAAVVEQLPCRGLVGVEAHAYQTVCVNGAEKSLGPWPPAPPPEDGSTGRGEEKVDVPLFLIYPPTRPLLVSAAAAAIVGLTAAGPNNMGSEVEATLATPLHSCGSASASVSARSGVHCPVHYAANHGAVTRFEDAAEKHSDGGAASDEPRLQRLWSWRWSRRRLRPHGRSLSLASGSATTTSSATEEAPLYVATDAVTRALLRPVLPPGLEQALSNAFVSQSVMLDFSYDEVRPLVYYLYTSYTILFQPLAGPERHNIFRRLVCAFGVPQQGVLEHLAARGAMEWLADVRSIKRARRPRVSRPPTLPSCNGDSAAGSGSWSTLSLSH